MTTRDRLAQLEQRIAALESRVPDVSQDGPQTVRGLTERQREVHAAYVKSGCVIRAGARRLKITPQVFARRLREAQKKLAPPYCGTRTGGA